MDSAGKIERTRRKFKLTGGRTDSLPEMPQELQEEAGEKEGIIDIRQDMNNKKEDKKIGEIRLNNIDGSRKSGEEDRAPKMVEQKGRNEEKLIESERYNNGHATRVNLLEEDEDGEVGTKANDLLLQTEVKLGEKEEIMSALIDIRTTCSGSRDTGYGILQDEMLPTSLEDEQSEKEKVGMQGVIEKAVEMEETQGRRIINTSQQKDNDCGMTFVQGDETSTVHLTTGLKRENGVEEINSVQEEDKEGKKSRWLSIKEKWREKEKDGR